MLDFDVMLGFGVMGALEDTAILETQAPLSPIRDPTPKEVVEYQNIEL